LAGFYADENFPAQVVEALRRLGHDVLTAFEAGQANRAVTDREVIEFATARGRVVLTLNRWDFVHLHEGHRDHSGIIACTPDPDGEGQARRIDAAVRAVESLAGMLVRINRPSRPADP
jgi:hypothetical protein